MPSLLVGGSSPGSCTHSLLNTRTGPLDPPNQAKFYVELSEHFPPSVPAEERSPEGCFFLGSAHTEDEQCPPEAGSRGIPLLVSILQFSPGPASPQENKEKGSYLRLLIKPAPALLNHPELGSAGTSALHNAKLHPPAAFFLIISASMTGQHRAGAALTALVQASRRSAAGLLVGHKSA